VIRPFSIALCRSSSPKSAHNPVGPLDRWSHAEVHEVGDEVGVSNVQVHFTYHC
jgi:hypothetical protein